QRLYTLFIGPPQKDAEWNDSAVAGANRFLNRVWMQIATTIEYLGQEPEFRDSSIGSSVYEGTGDNLSEDAKVIWRKTHQTIRKVTNDIDNSWQFNTAIAAIMELSNEISTRWQFHSSAKYDPSMGNETRNIEVYPRGFDVVEVKPGQQLKPYDSKHWTTDWQVLRFALESMVKLLGPMVPHVAEELWQMMGHEGGIIAAGWPPYSEEACREDVIELGVQVNGKLRGHVTVAAGTDDKTIEQMALADDKVVKAIGGATVRKVIVVAGRLVNIVAK
ncbi:MAG: class I tRNA ligase family protein, partial [Planctomycetes bacterium]|nr:class I tRNA ligase family protein [Planctomycetota bacterium]